MNKIQRADMEDAYEILTLQKLAYISEAEILGDYTIQPLTQSLDSLVNEFDHNLILKYVSEGKIIGSIRANEEKGTCYISKLMVHPNHQNKGIGKALVREIENVFSSVRYELFTSSQSIKNVSFYEKLGFRGYKAEKLATEETIFVFMEK
jgi:ribosomal protein S18 acetylase RimI-like enzyme